MCLCLTQQHHIWHSIKKVWFWWLDHTSIHWCYYEPRLLKRESYCFCSVYFIFLSFSEIFGDLRISNSYVQPKWLDIGIWNLAHMNIKQNFTMLRHDLAIHSIASTVVPPEFFWNYINGYSSKTIQPRNFKLSLFVTFNRGLTSYNAMIGLYSAAR